MSNEFNKLTRMSSDGALSVITLNESWAGRRLLEALKQLPSPHISLQSSNYGSLNDMRFQQKQQHEREQRKIEMSSNNNNSKMNNSLDASLSSTFGTGKVRQMFDERRQLVRGIDKSYPLKPIATSGSVGSTTARTSTTARKQQIADGPANSRKLNVANDNSFLSKKHFLNDNSSFDQLDNETFPDFENEVLSTTISTKLPNVGKLASLCLDDKHNNNIDFVKMNNGVKRNQISGNSKLKPLQIKVTTPTASKSIKSQPNVARSKTQSPSTADAKTPAGPSSHKKPGSSTVKIDNSTLTRPPSSNPPENMDSCRICGRFFNKDRIEKHEQICEKTKTKKRKVFDVTKHRVKGTEAEAYLKKPVKNPATTARAKAAPVAQTSGKKSDWRRKHEEFIQAIRAAKEVQAHLARGGKLSDLPPPPPSENPDYKQCPHCLRKFNETAAQRHIPKCANMLHNKPKPVTAGLKKKR